MADSALMNKLNDLLRSVSVSRHQEDFVDRLNFRVMTGVLLTAATAIFAKDYMGNPIQCWTSAEWPKSWTEYAHDICFVENTYYVPMSETTLPHRHADRQRLQLGYYQWVPFLLVFLSLGFLMPNLIWQYINSSMTGIPVRAILSMINDARHSACGISTNTRQTIARHLSIALVRKSTSGHMSRYSACVSYCAVKCLYIVNIIFQMWFLCIFLSGGTNEFGFGMIHNFVQGKMWRESGYFPRVTICDFQVRSVMSTGDIERNSVQCVLMGNMINEKVFVLLFLLLLVLGAVTVVNAVFWARLILFGHHKREILRRLLMSANVDMIYPIESRHSVVANIVSVACDKHGISLARVKEDIERALALEIDNEKNVESLPGSDDSDAEDQRISCNGSTVTESTTTDAVIATSNERPHEKEENKLPHSKTVYRILRQIKRKYGRMTSRECLDELMALFQLSRRRTDLENYLADLQDENDRCTSYELFNADGILVLELIRRNSNDVFATAILIQVLANHLADETTKHFAPLKGQQ